MVQKQIIISARDFSLGDLGPTFNSQNKIFLKVRPRCERPKTEVIKGVWLR